MKKSYISLSVISVVAVMGSMSLSSVPAFAEIGQKEKAYLASKLGGFPALDSQLKFLSEVKKESQGSIKGVNWRQDGVQFRLSPGGVRIERIVGSAELLFSRETGLIGIVVDASVPGVSDFLTRGGYVPVFYGGKRARLSFSGPEFSDFRRKSKDAGMDIVCFEFFASIPIDKTAFRTLSSHGRYSLNDLLLAEDLTGHEMHGVNPSVITIVESMSSRDRDGLRHFEEVENLLRAEAHIKYSLDVSHHRAELHVSLPGIGIEYENFMREYEQRIFSSPQERADVHFGFNRSFNENDYKKILEILEGYNLQIKADVSGSFMGYGWEKLEMEKFQRALEDSRWDDIGGSQKAYIRDIYLYAGLTTGTIDRIQAAGVDVRDVARAVAREKK